MANLIDFRPHFLTCVESVIGMLGVLPFHQKSYTSESRLDVAPAKPPFFVVAMRYKYDYFHTQCRHIYDESLQEYTNTVAALLTCCPH